MRSDSFNLLKHSLLELSVALQSQGVGQTEALHKLIIYVHYFVRLTVILYGVYRKCVASVTVKYWQSSEDRPPLRPEH